MDYLSLSIVSIGIDDKTLATSRNSSRENVVTKRIDQLGGLTIESPNNIASGSANVALFALATSVPSRA